MSDAVQFAEDDHNYLHWRWEAQGGPTGTNIARMATPWCCAATAGKPTRSTAAGTSAGRAGRRQPLRHLGAGRQPPVIPEPLQRGELRLQGPQPRTADVPSLNDQGQMPPMEVHDYAGAYGFQNAADGDALSPDGAWKPHEAGAKHFSAEGDADTVQPGRSFTLAGPYDIQAIGRGRATTNSSSPTSITSSATTTKPDRGQAAEYRARFTCLRKRIPWRPTPGHSSHAPQIHGLQTARRRRPAWPRDPHRRIRLGACSSTGTAAAGTMTSARPGCASPPTWPANTTASSPCPASAGGDRPVPRRQPRPAPHHRPRHNADNRPPHFNNAGSLPANHAVSGWSTRELHGTRLQQLRFDDSPGQIGAQLASEHGHTALNQGWSATTPRRQSRTRAEKVSSYAAISPARSAPRRASHHQRRASQSPGRGARPTGARRPARHRARHRPAARRAGRHPPGRHGRSPASCQAHRRHQALANRRRRPGHRHQRTCGPRRHEQRQGHRRRQRHRAQPDRRPGRPPQHGAQTPPARRARLAAFAHKAGMKLIAAAGKPSLQAQSDEMEMIAAKLLRLASLESILLESARASPARRRRADHPRRRQDHPVRGPASRSRRPASTSIRAVAARPTCPTCHSRASQRMNAS